jgi:transcriptional regulator GlxA family with amidase domain
MPFALFTVAETREPITASAGLRIIPNYALQEAPSPHVIVIGAQSGHTPAAIDWIRARAAQAQLTMSVCTGAFLLAKTACSTASRPPRTTTSTTASRASSPP